MKTTAILAYLIVTGFLASASTWYAAAEMAAYQAAQESAAAQPKRDRETIIKTILGELRTLKNSTGPLDNTQRDRALRRFAELFEALIEELRP